MGYYERGPKMKRASLMVFVLGFAAAGMFLWLLVDRVNVRYDQWAASLTTADVIHINQMATALSNSQKGALIVFQEQFKMPVLKVMEGIYNPQNSGYAEATVRFVNDV